MRQRNKVKRRPHKVYLVVCEGETEADYINQLKRAYRVPVTIKTRVCGNVINKRLVDQYVAELGVGSDSEYEVFYIYDCDVRAIAEKLMKLKGHAILSNPCIELWFLLHSREFNRQQSSKAVLDELQKCSEVWRYYEKGELSKKQTEHLLENRHLAIERSKHMAWPENPSTNMYEFLEAIESENC